jgi:Protein of unknown function (DUF3307)
MTKIGAMLTQSDLIPVFALIAALQAKHFVADGPLQTHAMVLAKSFYGKRDGIIHSAIHALGTMIVFGLFQFPVRTVLVLALVDFFVHYHVDYSKENIVKKAGWTVKDGPFWWALSADQMLHQFTYLALAFVSLTT